VYWQPGNGEAFLDLVEKLTGKPLTGDAWVDSEPPALPCLPLSPTPVRLCDTVSCQHRAGLAGTESWVVVYEKRNKIAHHCVYMMNKEAKSSQGTATHGTERANCVQTLSFGLPA